VQSRKQDETWLSIIFHAVISLIFFLGSRVAVVNVISSGASSPPESLDLLAKFFKIDDFLVHFIEYQEWICIEIIGE